MDYMSFTPRENIISVFTYKLVLKKSLNRPSSQFDLEYVMLSKF
jgi:hypothetical protein